MTWDSRKIFWGLLGFAFHLPFFQKFFDLEKLLEGEDLSLLCRCKFDLELVKGRVRFADVLVGLVQAHVLALAPKAVIVGVVRQVLVALDYLWLVWLGNSLGVVDHF